MFHLIMQNYIPFYGTGCSTLDFMTGFAMGYGNSANYQRPSMPYTMPYLNSCFVPQFVPIIPSFTPVLPSLPTFGGYRSSTVISSQGAKNDSIDSSSDKNIASETVENSKIKESKINKKKSGYGPEFLKKVKQVSKNLNCNYKDLLAVMNSESGIDAQRVASNGATGLIMFMPQYFDTAAIRKMTPVQQLDLVEKTIMKSKKAAGFAANAKLSKGDLYALVFLPARANKEVLCTKGERGKNGKLLSYYESNKALDYNKDGKITKSEMATRIDKKYVSDSSFLA